MNKKNKMKLGMIIQALSMIAVLTIIGNLPYDAIISNIGWNNYISNNIVQFCVLIICGVWFIASVLIWICFNLYKNYDSKGGYVIKNIVEKKDVGINFFIAVIIPLVLYDINNLGKALMLLTLILLLIVLMFRTNLYYCNPLLTILGYKIYEFEFVANDKFGSEIVIGIVPALEKINDINTIKYKVITNNILYVGGNYDDRRNTKENK